MVTKVIKDFLNHQEQDGHQGRDENHGQGQTGQTKLTLKLDFTGNLCRAAFAILAMFYTWFGMDYSLNL